MVVRPNEAVRVAHLIHRLADPAVGVAGVEVDLLEEDGLRAVALGRQVSQAARVALAAVTEQALLVRGQRQGRVDGTVSAGGGR